MNTTERDRCVQLVTELILPTYAAGQMSTVQRWLSALGDPAVEGYPPLAVLAGWVAALTGQTAEAERWAAIVDAASFDLVPGDGTASFDSARAMLRAFMCPAGPEQGWPTRASRSRRSRRGARGATPALACPPRRICSSETSTGPPPCSPSRPPWPPRDANGDSLVLSESELAVLAMERGRWAEAAEHVERALTAVDEHRMHDYATSLLAFAAAARLASREATGRRRSGSSPGRCGPVPSCTFVLPIPRRPGTTAAG